ncbi:hypothetical protein [Pedobacter faecalis]|uniref:hypothetical protein n=1 Tax=Pedobacter faecalis TaxID=3041495 RepID=UPI0025515EFD|nr:hypothetical protein [Pedobacter sp. ELA7]
MAFQIRNLFLVLCLATAFVACKEDLAADCEANKICTEQYVSIVVRFESETGAAVNVGNYTAKNLRTGKVLMEGEDARTDVTGTYVVTADNQLKLFSESGDEVEVSGTNVATGDTKTAIFKIKGGKCNCHVEKISGPEKIVFLP